jgi:NitT/TauT family transport system substrate-binding protein
MLRRHFVASGLAAAALAPAAGRAQTLTAIRVATAPDEDCVACLYAIQSGLFRRNGLDVTLTANTSGSAISAAIAGGSIDIGKASLLGLIAGHVHGVPFTIIAPAALYNSDAPVSGTIVRADSPIKTAKDLSGKTVSVQSVKGILQIVTMNWIDSHGGDSDSVKFLELPPSSVAAALAGGRVDAATFTNPLLAAALATKQTRVLAWPFDSLGKRYLMAGYFCTTDYAAKNADAVARFARVIGEAATYTNAHPAETVDMVAKFTSVSADDVAHMTRVTCGVKLDPRDIQPVVDVAAKYKVIPARFDAKEMIDPAMLGAKPA